MLLLFLRIFQVFTKWFSESLHLKLFAEDEVNIVEKSPRQSRGDYSTILTEPEVDNCFSIFTRSDLNRINKETIKKRLV